MSSVTVIVMMCDNVMEGCARHCSGCIIPFNVDFICTPMCQDV